MPSRSALASPAGAVGQRRVGPAARPPPTPPCEDPGTPPAPPCAGLALLGQSAQGSHRDNQPNASATYQSSSSSASRVSKTIRHPEHRARHPERCIKRREKIKQRPVGSCHLSFSVTCLGPRLTVLRRLLDCFFALRHRTSTRDAGDLFSSAQASSSPPRPSVSVGVNCSFAEQPRLCGEKHHGEADPGVPGCDAAGGGHLRVRTTKHQSPKASACCPEMGTAAWHGRIRPALPRAAAASSDARSDAGLCPPRGDQQACQGRCAADGQTSSFLSTRLV